MQARLHPARPLLLVDDDEDWSRSFCRALHCAGLSNVQVCTNPGEVMPMLERQEIEMVLLDVELPQVRGDRMLEEIRRRHPDIPVLMVTALEDVDLTMRCMQAGAANFLIKTTHKSQLVAMVQQTLNMRDLQRVSGNLKQALLEKRLRKPEALQEILTCDQAMHLLFQYLEAVAESPEPLLITGETGTGKELIARALHRLSVRPGPLVAVNVAGLDDEAFSDTLFGHIRGAFTGALDRRGGLVERAEGGTLFLDEIGDLCVGSQVKLLRLLQEGEYLPLGADAPRRCDIRIVAATHCDLSNAQREGRFRKDLFYRLRTHHVNIPPLRNRPDDIPLLAAHFLEEACSMQGRRTPDLPQEVVRRLLDHPFPGNIRELRAIMHDAASRMQGDELHPGLFHHLTAKEGTAARPQRSATDLFRNVTVLPSLKEAQELLIAEALRRTHHNQAAAASLIGVTRQAINQRLKAGLPYLTP